MDVMLDSKKKQFAIALTLRTKKPERIRIVATDAFMSGRRYSDRTADVNGEMKFMIRFPYSPYKMKLSIYNVRHGNVPLGVDKSFTPSEFQIKALDSHPMRLTAHERAFMKFMGEFAEAAAGGVLSIGEYKSDDRLFTIRYFNEIPRRDEKGNIIGKSKTPASIGHTTKTFNFAKKYISDFTIPEIAGIGTHEYGHGFKNVKIKRDPTSEVAADICGSWIYLNYGLPSSDLWNVFENVLYNSPSEENQRRLPILKDFIKKFDRGEITSFKS